MKHNINHRNVVAQRLSFLPKSAARASFRRTLNGLTTLCVFSLSLILGSVAQALTTTNPGYEAGNLTGWTFAGLAAVDTSNPASGSFHGVINSGEGVVSGTPVTSATPYQAHNGSGMKTTITGTAGEVVSFQYNFMTREFANSGVDFTFNDTAFVVISKTGTGTVRRQVLASVALDLPGSSNGQLRQTGYRTFTYTLPADGTYSFGFGVVNAGDTSYPSALQVDDQLTNNPGTFPPLVLPPLTSGGSPSVTDGDLDTFFGFTLGTIDLLISSQDPGLNLDFTPPVVTVPANISVTGSGAGAVVTYAAPTATDNVGVVSLTQTAGLASGATFPLGTTTNVFQATDAAGNTGNASFTVTVTAPTATPEIAVFNGASTAPANERADNVGTQDLGGVNTGSSSAAQTFTIQNLGSATADLTGLVVTSTNATEFTFTAPLAATLAPGATTTFTVTFSPSGTGARSGVIKIASNDTDENPFDIMLTGTGLVPEIGIANSLAVDIPDTGSQAFGTTEVGLDLFQTFTVSNSGTGALSLGAITFGGSHPSDFIVSTAPGLSSVPASGSTTFTVRFRPLGAGARSAVMSIVNDDADENPFDITLSGTGLAPEVVVHNGSHSLAPELSDGQVTVVNFGSTAQNVASVRSFLVRNTGDAPLDITTITIPAGYNTNGAAVTMAPGTSYSFQVSLESATPATYAGNVVINSDDLSEAAFDFPVTGTVVAPGSAPVVNVGGEVAVTGTTGSTVLGGPVGSTLYSFIGSPALNSSGVLASAVQIRHADASLHSGMMVGQPLVLIATDTQTAPSLPGVTHFSFSPPVINEAGYIAFTGEVRGAGITANVNSRCLFSNASDGTLKLVARIGTNVGLGSNLKTIGTFSIGGDLVIFLGTLVDNRSVLFGWDANTGLRPLMRNGQSLDANGVTKTVKSFSILATTNASSGHGKELSVAPTGESLVTFSVVFTDGTSGVVVGSFDGTSDTGFGLTYGTSQQLADTYATAPGVIPLAKWGSFRSPGFDNTGSYYGFISQMVTNTLAGVSTTNNVGVFVDTAPGVLTLQLRENDAAPGTSGLVFSDFSDLVLGGGDYEYLVKGEVHGSGVVTNVNDKGLWAQHATNGLALVAREGSEAPGVVGSTFYRLSQIALPGTAQPMFQATMTNGVGGVTSANDTGLWVINESGAVKLAVREGDTLNVDGTPRVVTAITALLNGTTTGGALGRRVFLQDGQLTLMLTFTGGIQANAKVVVP
jgi:hypothetical protein